MTRYDPLWKIDLQGTMEGGQHGDQRKELEYERRLVVLDTTCSLLPKTGISGGHGTGD